MFTTILCATDGSEHADRALGYATELTRQHDSELHIAHVTEKLVGGRMTGQDAFLNEAEINTKIKAQTAKLVSDGVDATLHIAKDTPSHVAERLAQIADQIDADLIVVGTRGHSPLGGLMLGNVTPRLLHTTHRPVLALPPTTSSHHPSPQSQRLQPAA
jgi:nucleotide-binding universal stress UspA family protein